MDQNELEILKTKFQDLIENNLNDTSLFVDVVKLFKIPIDESRVEDYRIIKMELRELSIQVLDVKTSTIFTSNYSKDSEVLGMIAYEERIKFINVFSINSLCERETVYYIGEETPILEKMIFHNNGYGLFFKKTLPGVINNFYKQDGIQFLVKYFKDDDKNKYDLLTSTYKTSYTYKNINSFERLVINDCPLTYDKNRPDCFFFDIKGNIISGNKLRSNDYFIDGACFEKIDDNSLLEALMNNPMEKIKDYSLIDIHSLSSAILYAGYSFFDKTRYFYDLQIGKADNDISIKYSVKDKSHYPEPITILEDDYIIPGLNKGKITIEEVDAIIIELKNKFSEDCFIQFVISELIIFKEKLAIKNGLSQEIISLLSPKLLMNETFDTIFELVNLNKENYFSLASFQFNQLTNTFGTIDKELNTPTSDPRIALKRKNNNKRKSMKRDS